MRALLTAVVGLCLWAIPAAAAEPVFAVEVAEAPTLAEAQERSVRFPKLAEQLGQLAPSTGSGAPERAGAGIQVYQAEDERFHVVAFVGPQGQATIALELIRHEVPTARLTEHRIELSMPESELVPVRVLVVGRDGSYPGAVAQARSFAARAGVPYHSRGLIWDSRQGLVFPPPTDEDTDAGVPDPFAGGYFYRRTDSCGEGGECVSIEEAEAYGGDRGELWAVAGVALDEEDARTRIAAVRRFAPQARAVAAWVWMGCPL